MTSFADELRTAALPRLRRQLDLVSTAEVDAALARPESGFADYLLFLSPAAGERLEPLARRAARITRQRFGRTIQLYAPIYLSNECVNGCRYCGFHQGRPIPRRTLDLDELRAEADFLHDQGFRHLLLVAGEAPAACPVEHVEAALRLLAPRFASLAIEVWPLSVEEYRRAVAAGADGVALYQETYDRPTYAAVHPSGPKRRFEHRLAALERAGEAGLARLGLGALLGLHDVRSEAIALGLHVSYLQRRFWRSAIQASVPRLRQVPEGFVPPAPVTDAELVQLLLALRNAFPDLGLVLSTREPAALRNSLIPLGITQLSAGSCTEPGGYATPGSGAGAQFAVEDRRSAAEVAALLRDLGYDPVWKDWFRGDQPATEKP